MLLSLCAVAFGLIALVYAADRFVAGASTTARALGVPALLVGLTVVGIGTSLPEIVVATIASLQGKPALAIGNAVGSNITNIALVLGVCALITPLSLHSTLVRREMPVVMAVSLLAWALALDGYYSLADGLMLLVGLLALLGALGYLAQDTSDPIAAELHADAGPDMPLKAALGWLLFGLLLLPLSSQALVWGAANIAVALGISELVVGLTVVAIGTSLPELATALAAVKKREHDLVLGNIIGSNLFNILAVLAIPALLAPGPVPVGLLGRDLPIMLALTALLFFVCWGATPRIGRVYGAVFLGAFVAYEGLLYLSRFQ